MKAHWCLTPLKKYGLIFIAVLKRLKVSYRNIWFLGTLIALSAVFLVDYKNGIFEFHGIIGMIIGKASLLGARVVTSFFYIPAGIVLSLWKENKYPLWILIIIGVSLEFISPGFGFTYETGRALATIGIVHTLVGMVLNPSSKYFRFRQLSSALYYWHLWLYTALSFLMFGMGNMQKGALLYFAVVAIIVVLFGIKEKLLKKWWC